MAKTPEGDVKAKIVEFLVGHGGVVEPLMTGLVGARGRHYSTPVRSLGRPDLIYLWRGAAIAIEVKAGTVQRPTQAEWQKRWEAQGGRYVIVQCVEDVGKYLDSMLAMSER